MIDRRAMSSVVGVILIVGFTLATVTTVLAVGTVVLSDAQTDAHTSQMENSMAQLASKVSLVALDKSGEMDFQLGEVGDGDVIVDPDAGSVSVIYKNNTTEETLFNESFGAVIYRSGDTEIAYQGGGVWKRYGTGSSMLSPPEIHYKERTLTFPVIRVVGDSRTSRAGAGSIVVVEQGDPIYPNGSHRNPLEYGNIVLEIRSEYHWAWNRYFTQRTEAAVTHDPLNETVHVNLTVPFGSAFDSPVTATDDGGIDIHGGGSTPEGWRDGQQDYPSATKTVQNRIDECSGNASPCNSTPSDLSGELAGNRTYFIDGDATVDNSVTFNTTDGDIRLVIDGDLDVGNNEIIVSGDHELTVYMKGAYSLGGNGRVNPDKTADRLTMYFHTDSAGSPTINLGTGTPEMAGAIYAPNSDAELSGNAEFEGSIIAKEISINGGPAGGIGYDPTLQGKQLGIDIPPDRIKYLHVTDNQVEIKLEN